MRRIPADVKREAIRLRTQEQLSTPTIARKLGVCNHTIYAILKRHPWTGDRICAGPRATWTNNEIETLRRLWPIAEQTELERALPARRYENMMKKASALKIKRHQPASRRNPRFVHPAFKQLRQVREANGLTRPMLAAKIGVHQNQLHAWELGKAKPDFLAVCDWCDALGYDIALQQKIKANGSAIDAPTKAALMGSGARTPIVRVPE